MNQFYYKRKVGEKEYEDSFSFNKVIRTVELETGERLVLLDDLHERLEKVPQINPKTGKVTGQTKERNTYQSEITLSKEDSERYVKISKLELNRLIEGDNF